MPGFLCHVLDVFKADEGKEGEERPASNGGPACGITRRQQEFGKRAALDEEGPANGGNHQQGADLEDGDHRSKGHAFAHTHHGNKCHQDNDGGKANTLGNGNDRLHIAGKGKGNDGGRGDCNGNDQIARDAAGKSAHAMLDEHRLSGSLGIDAGQQDVGIASHASNQPGDQEGIGNVIAGHGEDFADQREDAGPDRDADTIEDEPRQGQAAAEFLLGHAGPISIGACPATCSRSRGVQAVPPPCCLRNSTVRPQARSAASLL